MLIVLLYGNRTFVNKRSRDVIMEEMRQRIDRGDSEKEIEEVIQVSHLYFPRRRGDFLISWQAMCDIAKSRAGELV